MAGAQLPAGSGAAPSGVAVAEDRRRWRQWLERLAEPVLVPLAEGRLRASMPVEVGPEVLPRDAFSHLEAFARLLSGLAPWLELGGGEGEEAEARGRFKALAHRALQVATDPASPDFLNFTDGRQPLVDAAYLAQALLRAPRTLCDSLEPATRLQLMSALASTRSHVPPRNNWVLFPALVEAGLARLGASWDALRVELSLREVEAWYKGDGAYGDGPAFRWDYYNSFVLHPMLLDLLGAFGREEMDALRKQGQILRRAQRYAEVLERLIGPDGSFPPLGRSLAYRCGVLQPLGQLALRGELPVTLAPGQVRAAMSAVIERTLGAPGTFDARGFLRIGLAGHQPELGEAYISTGSLYMCATAFLPLGLPPEDIFWSDVPRDWTARRVWSGGSVPRDVAID